MPSKNCLDFFGYQNKMMKSQQFNNMISMILILGFCLNEDSTTQYDYGLAKNVFLSFMGLLGMTNCLTV